jgi:hypothetical protein
VRRLIPASVAVLVLCGCVALVSNSFAQTNGVPSSVTSPGFGGRAVNGTPPSVTSVGPGGYAPNSRVTFSGGGSGPGADHRERHHHRDGKYVPSIGYAYPVPYAVDLGAAEDDAPADDDADYQGGPTVFDRRGSGADSYVPPVRDVPRPHSVARAEAEAPANEPPQPQTVLVFKDGHDIEVGNYAIVGETLFDLTPGHARKVAVADLDLDATRKQNEDRGVVFELPASPQAN